MEHYCYGILCEVSTTSWYNFRVRLETTMKGLLFSVSRLVEGVNNTKYFYFYVVWNPKVSVGTNVHSFIYILSPLKMK